jgi:hypothetical protein
MRTALACLILVAAACGPPAAAPPPAPEVVPAFEIALWPGEGIPVIEAARDALLLGTLPRAGAPVRDTVATRRGERLTWDSTRYQTIDPGLVLVTAAATVHGRNLGAIRFLSQERYYSTALRDTNFQVAPPDTLVFLQHRAEGTCFVRTHGVVVDAQECPALDRATFRVLREPVTQWWIRVRRPNVSGWVQVTDTTARVVDRTF